MIPTVQNHSDAANGLKRPIAISSVADSRIFPSAKLKLLLRYFCFSLIFSTVGTKRKEFQAGFSRMFQSGQTQNKKKTRCSGGKGNAPKRWRFVFGPFRQPVNDQSV
jgi:hypothetical protein